MTAVTASPTGTDETSRRVGSAVEDTVALFSLLGWPEVAAVRREYVCAWLTEASSRTSAFEALRRDWQACALLDLPGPSWLALLRVVLGNPDPDLARTDMGRGVLLRLLVGEPLRALLADDELLAEVVLSAPVDRGGIVSSGPGHIELERAELHPGRATARADLGDVDGLAASIERDGLLQPITIDPEGSLVCGLRWRRCASWAGRRRTCGSGPG